MTMSNIKTVGIIAAMDTEINGIKSSLENVIVETYSGIDFYKGTYKDATVIAAKCGVGKVFAALCTEAMILKYNPDCIINTGVAGALNKELKVLDVVIADKVSQHDMDTSAIGDPVGLISGINKVYFETDKDISERLCSLGANIDINTSIRPITSGDLFVEKDTDKKRITDNFEADVCEMEGGAIGHVAFVNNIPFAVVRAISDAGDGMDFVTFADIAAKNSIKLIMSFLESVQM